MLPIAQEFFKKNREAPACHVVLDRIFDNINAAKAYQHSVSAHGITSYLKEEAAPPAEKKSIKPKN